MEQIRGSLSRMEKLEQILCGSWSSFCFPVVSAIDRNDKNDKWENSLISLGCGFIRGAKTTNHLGWAIKPNRPAGFVLAKHPKDKYFIDKKNCDYCLIPEDLALKIIALEYLDCTK